MENNKSNDNKKSWKSYFLSSGYPLEFELTQLLVKHKYAVEGEFPYNRKDRGETKEFSIDINALNYF